MLKHNPKSRKQRQRQRPRDKRVRDRDRDGAQEHNLFGTCCFFDHKGGLGRTTCSWWKPRLGSIH